MLNPYLTTLKRLKRFLEPFLPRARIVLLYEKK